MQPPMRSFCHQSLLCRRLRSHPKLYYTVKRTVQMARTADRIVANSCPQRYKLLFCFWHLELETYFLFFMCVLQSCYYPKQLLFNFPDEPNCLSTTLLCSTRNYLVVNSFTSEGRTKPKFHHSISKLEDFFALVWSVVIWVRWAPLMQYVLASFFDSLTLTLFLC